MICDTIYIFPKQKTGCLCRCLFLAGHSVILQEMASALIPPQVVGSDHLALPQFKLLPDTGASVCTMIVEDKDNRPFMLIDEERCSFISEEKISEVIGRSGLVVLTHDNFRALGSHVVSTHQNEVHRPESLMGKQKHCLLCKLVGRKTKDGTLPVRSRVKCNVCQVALCKGYPRNCFQAFHQMFQMTKFPELQWLLL